MEFSKEKNNFLEINTIHFLLFYLHLKIGNFLSIVFSQKRNYKDVNKHFYLMNEKKKVFFHFIKNILSFDIFFT